MNRKLVFGLTLLVGLFVLVGCGGSGDDTNKTTSSGSPTDTVKSFYSAVMAGEGDPTTLFCSSLSDDDKQQIQAGFEASKSAFTASGATIDISGLTYTEQNVTADSAEVVVGGTMKVTTNGTSQDVPMQGVTIPLKNENGWKLCQ